MVGNWATSGSQTSLSASLKSKPFDAATTAYFSTTSKAVAVSGQFDYRWFNYERNSVKMAGKYVFQTLRNLQQRKLSLAYEV